MCHDQYFDQTHDWMRDRAEAEDEEDLPEHLNEEGAEDVELLTDGGDE